MTDSGYQLTNLLPKTILNNEGVSFKGQSLVLNSEKDCDEVVKTINSCQNLHCLNFEGNTLGVEACEAISKALESKKELKRALWSDMFTGRKKEEIPRALEHLGKGLTLAGAQLTELDLSDNAFGPIGVQGLAELLRSKVCYQLKELKLNNNGLGISGGEILANALLDCYKNSREEGKPLALRLFIAGRNRLENSGAAQLAKVFQMLGTLEEIVMPQNGIFHKGIKALSESFKFNPNLKVLDLNDNIITKKGAKHIANALPHLQQLKILNLEDCLLRTGGICVIAEALAEGHEHLEELHLGSNEIKSEGGIALVKAVTNKTKLKCLNLNGNIIGSAGQKLLKDGLEKIKKLSALSTMSDNESCESNDDSDNDDEENENEESEEENENEESEEENENEESEEENENEESEEENENEESEEEDENEESEEENENEESEEENENEEGEEENESDVHTNGFAEVKVMPRKNPTSDVLSDLFEDLSVKAKPSGPLKVFLDFPTLANFLAVKEDKIYEFINNNKDSSLDFYVDTFIPLLVKVSSMTCSNDKEAVKLSTDVSRNLYKVLFSWAVNANHLATVNNILFVHLGLVKSEDKSFKITWDVQGSISALKAVISEDGVPSATKDILKCFLDKETSKQFCEEIDVG